MSVIPASVADNGLKLKMFKILKETDVPIDPSIVEDYHRLPSKGSPKKIIRKLIRDNNIRRTSLRKNKLRRLKPESVNVPEETNVFIDESLCLHYKKTVVQM